MNKYKYTCVQGQDIACFVEVHWKFPFHCQYGRHFTMKVEEFRSLLFQECESKCKKVPPSSKLEGSSIFQPLLPILSCKYSSVLPGGLPTNSFCHTCSIAIVMEVIYFIGISKKGKKVNSGFYSFTYFYFTSKKYHSYLNFLK